MSAVRILFLLSFLVPLLPPLAAAEGLVDRLGVVRLEPPSGALDPVRRKQRLKRGNSVKVILRYELQNSERAKLEVALLADRGVRYRSVPGMIYVMRGSGTVELRTGVRCRKRSPDEIRLRRLRFRMWAVNEELYETAVLTEGELAVDFRVRCPRRGGPAPAPLPGPGRDLPDLVITELTGPATARPGEAIGPWLRLEIANRGRGPALGRDGYLAHVDLVLSSDRRVEGLPATASDRFHEDVLLPGGRLQLRDDLRPGARVRLRGEGRLPRRIRPGRYYLCAAVDSTDRVRERREDDNVACMPLRVVDTRPVPPPPPPLREDCVRFDPDWLEVERIGGRWKLVELLPGGRRHLLLDFDGSRREAELTRRILRHYGVDRLCFVGRPDPSLTYVLRGSRPPEGRFVDEDCVRFDPDALRVRRVGGRWKLVEPLAGGGEHWLLDFGFREDEARTALRIVRRYRFRRLCFVGRPDPGFVYLRR